MIAVETMRDDDLFQDTDWVPVGINMRYFGLRASYSQNNYNKASS